MHMHSSTRMITLYRGVDIDLLNFDSIVGEAKRRLAAEGLTGLDDFEKTGENIAKRV